MKNFLAILIVFAIRILESRPKPKPQIIYSGISYKYDNRHEDWNDYLRDTGL